MWTQQEHIIFPLLSVVVMVDGVVCHIMYIVCIHISYVYGYKLKYCRCMFLHWHVANHFLYNIFNVISWRVWLESVIHKKKKKNILNKLLNQNVLVKSPSIQHLELFANIIWSIFGPHYCNYSHTQLSRALSGETMCGQTAFHSSGVIAGLF